MAAIESPRIVVVGSLNADLVVHVPRFLVPGETLTGDRFDVFPGGKGGNQAAAAARLGGRVAMVGQVGNDFAFDSRDDSTETSSSLESHAVVRYKAGVAAGSHTVAVQWRTSNSSVKFRLDDWTLSVVAYKQ